MGVIANAWSKLFGKKTEKPSGMMVPVGWLNTYNQKAEATANSTYMNCVNCNARNFSKAVYRVYKGKEPAERKVLERLLNLRPNPLMSGPAFWKQVGRNYWETGLSIIWIEYDFSQAMPIKGLWPISVDSVVNVSLVNGEAYLEFSINGKKHYCKETGLIILKRNADELTGLFGKRSLPIAKSLEAIQSSYEGLAAAIKASQYIRFVIQSGSNVSDEVLKARQEEYAKRFFNSTNGVIFTNGNEKLTEINSNGKWPLAPELESLKNDIYEFQGCTPEIVKGKFKSDVWNSYYETTIEPLCNEISSELTYKLFTLREIEVENVIRAITDPLQVASLSERKGIADTVVKLPLYKPNDVLRLLYMDEVDGGDEVYQNQTYKQPGEDPDQPKPDDDKEVEEDD